MKQLKVSFYAMAFVIVALAASLAVPLVRGEFPIDLGLDLSGGVVVTYRPDFSSRLDAYDDLTPPELLALAKETLTSRLSRRLSTIPDVVVRGDQRIVVSIPGRGDQREVLELMGETYRLTFRRVLARYAEEVEGKELVRYHGAYLALAEPAFSGDMLDERSIRVATPSAETLDFEAMAPKVAFRFQPPHDAAFADFTAANVGRELAILIDDEVQWAGTVEGRIEGTGVLAGGYDLDEATDVAQMLKSGTLPVTLEVESLTAVGPTLGEEIRDLGVRALGLALLFLVALIAAAYLHRGSLLLAGLISLAVLLFLIVGLAAAFGLTLDMVGIAGVVLSVGMGMDAFILVFESLEDRPAAAAPRPPKARPGGVARRAYSFAGEGATLFHANATTLVVILLLCTTERLKSFAIFIFVGVLASVLTIFVTRAVLARTWGVLPGGGPDLLWWLRRLRLRLFRFRKAYFALLLVALTVPGTLLLTDSPGGASLAFGADFRRGTQLIVRGSDDAVDAALAAVGQRLPGIAVRRQQLGDPGQGRHLVTLGTATDTGLAEALPRLFAARSVDLESLASIDGRVSSDRLLKSLSVFVLSFFLLAVYFVALQEPLERLFSARGRPWGSASTRWRIFAGVLAAVVADVAVVVAFLALAAIPVNLPVIAAVLTIVGYSVNDSVVLWSHVRQRRSEERGSPLELVTRSVDAILSRAALTSVSTLVPALTILAVGLGPLEDFAWTMIVGTIAGTLSSIFIVGSFAVRALEREQGRSARTLLIPESGFDIVSPP